MPSQRAIIKPALLAWAREESGISLEDAAKKIRRDPGYLLACEKGEDDAHLTVRQLRILSNAYKRPLAFFYLPQPPQKSNALRDFRRPAQEEPQAESPKLRYEIRRARQRRKLALELLDDLGEQPVEFTARATLTENTFEVARRLRTILRVTRAQQRNFEDEYDAFNTWRDVIENIGVAVFQVAGVSGKEMLGFSFSEPILPVIALNMSDHPVRRIFTMMHEMAHLMLRTGGLCILNEVQDVEVFCNEVAGETLVPQSWLLDEPIIKARGPQREWDEDLIRELSRRYRVSRETFLRRLVIAKYATREFYERKREEYKQEYAAMEKAAALKRQRDKEQGKEGGGLAPSTRVVSESGRMFVRLVLESYRRDHINTSDVADYLDVRIKHLDKIAQAVEHPTLELGAA